MKTPITPNALLEMGFDNLGDNILFLNLLKISMIYVVKHKRFMVGTHITKATTIKDVKHLIRLFK
jgi:hypothetical protein